MALVSGRGSSLNPNARPFIPAVYRQVEDFSSEWWNLVENSAWFRNYWMSENQEMNFEGFRDSKEDDDITNLLPDTFDVGYHDQFPSLEAEFEDMVQSCEAYDWSMLRTIVKPQNGQGLEPALMSNLNLVSSSPKGRIMSWNSSLMLEPSRYNERAIQYMSPKHGPKRIHQPR